VFLSSVAGDSGSVAGWTRRRVDSVRAPLPPRSMARAMADLQVAVGPRDPLAWHFVVPGSDEPIYIVAASGGDASGTP
jgi:hypothetical protein